MRSLLLAIAVCVGCLCAAPAAAAVPALPAVFLHISDTHFSTNAAQHWALFGDREADLALLTAQVVRRLAPGAVVLTGDLVDGKDATGAGLQQEAEWRAYRAALDALASAGGVPEARLLDTRGNHDTFNLPMRGGAADWFASLAAEGRRSAPSRAFLHALRPLGQEAGCPAAMLLGLDLTTEPGLKSPTNFAGRTTPDVMREVEAALQAAALQVSSSCGGGEGAPPTIAYAHYPLSTLDQQLGTGCGLAVAQRARQSVHSMQGLAALLARHNVSAYLSGHLHASFGPRLHRIHATPCGGAMAELETSAWKDDRRFRILALDGAALSFVDLYFHAPGSPRQPGRADAPAAADPEWREARARRGWAVTAADPSCRVLDHVVLLTSPPDARYAPLGPLGQGGAGASGDGSVRALVLPLGDSQEPPEVSLHVELPGGGGLHRQGMALLAGPAEAEAGASRLLAYGVRAQVLLPCGKLSAAGQEGGGAAADCRSPAGLVRVQVVAERRGSPGHSTSAWQPAGLLCKAEPGGAQQRCNVVTVPDRAALGVSFLEWLVLAYNWPMIIPRLFLGLWALHFGLLLLLPRLLSRHLSPSVQGSPLFLLNSFHLLSGSGEAGVARWAAAALREGLAYLTWPLAALLLASTLNSIWVPMVLYALYILVGPWVAAVLLEGSPLALVFPYGVYGKFDGGGGGGGTWGLVSTPDTMFICFFHLASCVVPMTLWVACVVGRRMQQRGKPGGGRGGSGGGRPGGARWTAPQIAALLLVAGVNVPGIYIKMYKLMGGWVLLLSPGVTWTIPLAVLLVTVAGQPAQGLQGKGRE